MANYVLFGTGIEGKTAGEYLMQNGDNVLCYVDNSQEKIGTSFLGKKVISFNDYLKIKDEHTLYVTIHNLAWKEEVCNQLRVAGKTDFIVWDDRIMFQKERIISYSHPTQAEDVILWHVLKNYENIFYIDIGSNDPLVHSVTKLFYDNKNGHGINVEPMREYYEQTVIERQRDINLNIGCSDRNGSATIYYQNLMTTIDETCVADINCKHDEIEIQTLKNICDTYLDEGQEIHFLKIDAEGSEGPIIKGANWEAYRPWILIIEAENALDGSDEHLKWEDDLVNNHYHYIYSHGVNRYYVADEKNEFDSRFKDLSNLKEIYNIYHISLDRNMILPE